MVILSLFCARTNFVKVCRTNRRFRFSYCLSFRYVLSRARAVAWHWEGEITNDDKRSKAETQKERMSEGARSRTNRIFESLEMNWQRTYVARYVHDTYTSLRGLTNSRTEQQVTDITVLQEKCSMTSLSRLDWEWGRRRWWPSMLTTLPRIFVWHTVTPAQTIFYSNGPGIMEWK